MGKLKYICVMIFLASLLVGCSTNEDIYFFSDKLYYNHEGMEDTMSFCLNYAYSDECPTIELIDLHGEGLERVSYTLGDISEELFTKNLYNGYHIGSFYIDIDVSNLQDNDFISVSAITIKCNGKNKTINLNKDLVFVKNDFEEECYIVPMQPLQLASGLPTSDIEYPVYYVFDVNEEFTLTEISTRDLIGIKKISIFVNETELTNEGKLLPLVLSENDRLKLEVTFYISEEQKNANINTDIIIKGMNSEGQLVSRNIMLYLVGLADEKDANKLTSIIGK